MSKGKVFFLAFTLSAVAAAVPYRHPEGSLWGFPVLTTQDGARAQGRLVQWTDPKGLHATGTYDFADGRTLVESTSFSTTQGELAQTHWSWELRRGRRVEERYEVDFATGKATAFKRQDDGKPRHWKKTLTLQPGKTFAGVGFLYAVRNLRSQLVKGEAIMLEGVGFLPRPQKADVRISHAGSEDVRMGGRSLQADHFVIHPQIPRIAKLFVDAPDNHLWFYRASPPGFLRSRGEMMGLGEVTIDVLPSPGPARQARRRARP